METTNMRIRDWPRADRPRNKLFTKKPSDLSNAELLSMLIGPGNAKSNALKLAEKVLSKCDNRLSDLSKCTVRELMTVAGIGHAKASSIVAFAELSRRRQSEEALERPEIKESRDAVQYLTPLFRDLNYVAFGFLFLGPGGKIINFEVPFEGGITFTVVDIRIVFQKAILHKAVSIVVCHNQVSGRVRPSSFDKALTDQLVAAGRYLDINVLDHIIVGENDYYSFADHGNI